MDDDLFSFVDSPIIAPAPHPPKTDPNWRLSPTWLAIKGITKDEVFTPCGRMEKIKSILSNSTVDIKKEHGKMGDDAPLGYGKYATKSIREIKEDDPNYFLWMHSNVDKFRKQCEKLGIK